MSHFIDRRSNPKGRSLGNRQRFLRRARRHLKGTVDRAVRDRNLRDVAQGETVDIPTDGIEEPTFRPSSEGGDRTYVLPGNKDFVRGDRIPRPPGGQGEGGKEGAREGGGEDAFRFTLTRDEFLDLLFEDLELPDLVKRNLKELTTQRPRRAGYTTTGTPANMAVGRTARNAMGRRIALKRPSRGRIDALREEAAALEARDDLTDEEQAHLDDLRRRIPALEARRKAIPYMDPSDVRYARFEHEHTSTTAAVMVCLMDVSGSMGEREKDMAKRFFLLLHLFLERCYERIDIVFIRHTHIAQEVDEDTFFHSRETGGTVVSAALEEARRVLDERYPGDQWNIYLAQASDGENASGDSRYCAGLLNEDLLPRVQYYAYVEIAPEEPNPDWMRHFGAGELWDAYAGVARLWPHFAMRRVARRGDIYPVFRELFQRRETSGAGVT